ncbi:hypothetical protein ONS96_014438 [Cadophora gregata f. sp. sojae]|nr:hypothetical protein ONS96_014438 [Cadophora gregata f. sp. sojae]
MECPIRHVETEFGEGKNDNQLCATILEASSVLEGIDPRGRVFSASMKIHGPFSTAWVTEIGFYSREIGWNSQIATAGPYAAVLEPSQSQRDKPEQNCTYAIVEQGNLKGRCFLDVPLALCRSKPAEITVGDEVGLLLMSSTIALVLRPSVQPGAFIRVGFFKREDAQWKLFYPTEGILLV